MCFHAQQTQSQTAVHQHYGTQGPVSTGIYNGFSHPQMTVITAKEPKATTLYHWGLIPHWAKDKDIRRYTLNAKVETMAEKPSFRSAKRCLIVTDGFYEWQWQDTKGKKNRSTSSPTLKRSSLPLRVCMMSGSIVLAGRSLTPSLSSPQPPRGLCKRSITVSCECP